MPIEMIVLMMLAFDADELQDGEDDAADGDGTTPSGQPHGLRVQNAQARARHRPA